MSNEQSVQWYAAYSQLTEQLLAANAEIERLRTEGPEDFTSELAVQLAQAKSENERLTRDNHVMRGLLVKACDRAQASGPWKSLLDPAWFDEAERLTTDEPKEREGEG
mgnify:CR=1 FL=1